MRPDIIPGATLQDYELSDDTGKRRKLSELQGQDPMVVVLGRGGYCPKDRRQSEGLVQLHREMEIGHCPPLPITTDAVFLTRGYLAAARRPRPLLFGPPRRFSKDLRI